jgi:hypothetical protein
MGYNKVTKYNVAMVSVYLAIQGFLLVPMWLVCYAPRHTFATAAMLYNKLWFNAAKPVIQGYSESARRDAYFYAFINAGIDDRTKQDLSTEPNCGPNTSPSDCWFAWNNQKSYFDKWLNDRSNVETWADAGSYTYDYRDGSGRHVTVAVSGGGVVPLTSKGKILIGFYFIMIGPFWIPLFIPHGRIDAWLNNPPGRSVGVTVSRIRDNPTVSVGFWDALHPPTRASATGRMTGSSLGFGFSVNGFDYALSPGN